MNHLELLKKYMSVVIGKEGYDFAEFSDAIYSGTEYSQEQRDELKRISKELGYE